MDKIIIGFDEVGRGSLAGPVVVSCVLGNRKILIPNKVIIRDSKKMTKNQRERADIFIRKKFIFGIGKVEAREIDNIGINNSIKKAALLALNNLKSKTKINNNTEFWIDGRDKWIAESKTLISGDNLIPEISMASIIAKVYRDNLMTKLNGKFPEYQFEKHVGYGTKFHREAILKYGMIEKIHRKSFCQKIG